MVSSASARFTSISPRKARMIIDLVRLPDTSELKRRAEYHGVAW